MLLDRRPLESHLFVYIHMTAEFNLAETPSMEKNGYREAQVED